MNNDYYYLSLLSLSAGHFSRHLLLRCRLLLMCLSQCRLPPKFSTFYAIVTVCFSLKRCVLFSFFFQSFICYLKVLKFPFYFHAFFILKVRRFCPHYAFIYAFHHIVSHATVRCLEMIRSDFKKWSFWLMPPKCPLRFSPHMKRGNTAVIDTWMKRRKMRMRVVFHACIKCARLD